MKESLLECGKSLDYVCSCIYVSNINEDYEKRDFFSRYLLDSGVDKIQIKNTLKSINKNNLPKQTEVVNFYNYIDGKDKKENYNKEIKVIEYKGQVLETKHFVEITDEEWHELKRQYYEKPDFKLVKKQFELINKGGTKNDKITKKDIFC